MYSTSETDFDDFQWKRQPECAQFVLEQVEEAVNSAPWLRAFHNRLRNETGTRLIDWLDHIRVPTDQGLAKVGYLGEVSTGIHRQTLGLFPDVLVDGDKVVSPILGVRVESLADFLQVHHAAIREQEIEGTSANGIQIAKLRFQGGGEVHFIERHGDRGYVPDEATSVSLDELQHHLGSFRQRKRDYDDPRAGFEEALTRFSDARQGLGQSRACDLFFQTEREYWLGRNEAARVQYRRQQALGLGWANHDHHTYRCSREWFAELVHCLEQMGFFCRERFYAGADAGWGAQVMEHLKCGIVVFADVDMSEEEVTGDFSHEGLSARHDLGTVGLWCRLHGESFLTAGMHHLECQFDFDAARRQLAELGIPTMAPFTDFPHLKQAFTKGEMWSVPATRLAELVDAGFVRSEDSDCFEKTGAIGSHLEILERNDGYKGFNQTGINKIIMATNPKNQTGFVAN